MLPWEAAVGVVLVSYVRTSGVRLSAASSSWRIETPQRRAKAPNSRHGGLPPGSPAADPSAPGRQGGEGGASRGPRKIALL